MQPVSETASDGLRANPELPTNVGRHNIAIYHVAYQNLS